MTTDRTIEPRDVPLGGLRGLQVHRTLPSRPLPTIGAWCFVDHFGPTEAPMEVLPHPHTGLQTVTWPIEGSIRHRDSLGSDLVLRPRELNLMTSGAGVSHSEFSDPGPMHGIQLWVALPEDRRHGAADFEHHPDLPRVSGDGWEGVVLVGRFAGRESSATVHTPLVGVELRLQPGRHELELDSTFEYGVLAVDGDVTVAGESVAPAGAALPRARPCRTGDRGRAPHPGDAPRRRAVRGGDRHVVELHRPHARGGRGLP